MKEQKEMEKFSTNNETDNWCQKIEKESADDKENADSGLYCAYCDGYYFDNKSDDEDLTKCTKCQDWYHESCTGKFGNDLRQFKYGHNDHMWVKYRNKGFMLVHQQMTWMEAQSVCYSLSGFLATVSNSDEMKFIKSMTNVYPNNIWLGGTDMFAEERWVWYMGTHEPAGRAGENCLV
ncbi:unnamed protein product [Mytilus coruscus]|uniref:C-type lectin domain-containing protein n=1 Tax=Mytilus coruscus TaxID=42192 RepID=A0A6J8CTJ2_MYTCO|nr:unnamed protein product [Mytilus coruscus]